LPGKDAAVGKLSSEKVSSGKLASGKLQSGKLASGKAAAATKSAASGKAAAVVKPAAKPVYIDTPGPKVGSTFGKGEFDPKPTTPPIVKSGKASREAAAANAVAPAWQHPAVTRPTGVPTDGKPRKNQAGLTSKELEFYRDLLLAKRREIVGDMSAMEREALRSSAGSNLSNLPLHMADMGTDNYEQEFTLGLVEKDRNLLREINHALAKIQNGTYGICEGTGIPISKARLEAAPWARFSIEYARQKEKNGMGVRTL
jgi:RNA polymerase-binding protein DksA